MWGVKAGQCGGNASLEVLPYAGLCGIKPGMEIKKW